MRRRRTRNESIVSMDSFLDIVTNTLGLLILVATLTVLGSGDVKISLGTPMVRPATEGHERVIFECRQGRVVPVEVEFAEQDEEAIWKASSLDQAENIARRFNRGRTSNGFHRFELTALRHPVQGAFCKTELHPIDSVGDRVSELRNRDGEYASRLKTMAPEANWVFFIVREDSFEAFRAARKIAVEQGFEVGWQPMESETNIVFSPFGGKTGRQ